MIAALALVIGLGPFADPHRDAVAPAAEIAVTLRGRPLEHLALSTRGLPPGWIASFCTPSVCAPFRVEFTLPAGGVESLQVKLIRNRASARDPRTVTVVNADGARATIAYARVVVR